MLSSRGGLDIAELIFYIPAWIISIIVCRKHGWGRTSGWIFLFIFSLIRLMGAVAGIIAEAEQTNLAAYIVTAVFSSAGTTALLLTQIGILRRLTNHLSKTDPTTAAPAFSLIVLILLAMLGTGIASGVFLFMSEAQKQETGVSLAKATAGLAIVAIAFVIWCILRISIVCGDLSSSERPLLFASWAALPFLFIRVLYLVLMDFRVDISLFSNVNGNIYASAFMSVVPEFLVVAVFLAAGLRVVPETT